jgi:hypothetical protein
VIGHNIKIIWKVLEASVNTDVHGILQPLTALAVGSRRVNRPSLLFFSLTPDVLPIYHLTLLAPAPFTNTTTTTHTVTTLSL